jgi:hypothetical protein
MKSLAGRNKTMRTTSAIFLAVLFSLAACNKPGKKKKNIDSSRYHVSDDSMVVVTISCETNVEWLKDDDLDLADSYPALLNAEEVAGKLQVDPSFFDGYPRSQTLSYQYFATIDEQGEIDSYSFEGSSNSRIDKQVEENIQLLRFKPGIKDNQAVESYTTIFYNFKLDKKK